MTMASRIVVVQLLTPDGLLPIRMECKLEIEYAADLWDGREYDHKFVRLVSVVDVRSGQTLILEDDRHERIARAAFREYRAGAARQY